MAIAVPWPIKEAKENVFCIKNFKQDCYIYTNIISLNYTEDIQYNRILHVKVFILSCHKIDSYGRYIIFYQQELMKQNITTITALQL